MSWRYLSQCGYQEIYFFLTIILTYLAFFLWLYFEVCGDFPTRVGTCGPAVELSLSTDHQGRPPAHFSFFCVCGHCSQVSYGITSHHSDLLFKGKNVPGLCVPSGVILKSLSWWIRGWLMDMLSQRLLSLPRIVWTRDRPVSEFFFLSCSGRMFSFRGVNCCNPTLLSEANLTSEMSRNSAHNNPFFIRHPRDWGWDIWYSGADWRRGFLTALP